MTPCRTNGSPRTNSSAASRVVKMLSAPPPGAPGEGPDHEQLAPVDESLPPGPVRREVHGRLRRRVVRRLVEHHGLHSCSPVVAARRPR